MDGKPESPFDEHNLPRTNSTGSFVPFSSSTGSPTHRMNNLNLSPRGGSFGLVQQSFKEQDNQLYRNNVFRYPEYPPSVSPKKEYFPDSIEKELLILEHYWENMRLSKQCFVKPLKVNVEQLNIFIEFFENFELLHSAFKRSKPSSFSISFLVVFV